MPKKLRPRFMPRSLALEPGTLRISFAHGLGDNIGLIAFLGPYRSRKWDVRVNYLPRNEIVYRAAGIPFCSAEEATVCTWIHRADFNRPNSHEDYSGSKIYGNFGAYPFPELEDESPKLWEEICSLDMSSWLDRVLDADTLNWAQEKLADLPRPIVLIHSNGDTMKNSKDIPPRVLIPLYRKLTAAGCGIVLLDWHNRVPYLPAENVRHVLRHWGRISTLELAALMKVADCLIGIDSGPLHLAKMSKIPVVGCFHDLYPSCVTLPNPRAVFMVRDNEVNESRRRRWNVVEYAGAMPTADEIMLQVKRVTEHNQ